MMGVCSFASIKHLGKEAETNASESRSFFLTASKINTMSYTQHGLEGHAPSNRQPHAPTVKQGEKFIGSDDSCG